MANIVADILIRMAPDVKPYLAKGAHLICSGIIEDRAEDVAAAMAAGGFVPVTADNTNIKDLTGHIAERFLATIPEELKQRH